MGWVNKVQQTNYFECHCERQIRGRAYSARTEQHRHQLLFINDSGPSVCQKNSCYVNHAENEGKQPDSVLYF